MVITTGSAGYVILALGDLAMQRTSPSSVTGPLHLLLSISEGLTRWARMAKLL